MHNITEQDLMKLFGLQQTDCCDVNEDDCCDTEEEPWDETDFTNFESVLADLNYNFDLDLFPVDEEVPENVKDAFSGFFVAASTVKALEQDILNYVKQRLVQQALEQILKNVTL